MAESEVPKPKKKQRRRKSRTRRRNQAATRKMRYDKVFLGKKFDIVEEIHLEEDQYFKTVFGMRARHGVVLQNRDDPNDRIAIGMKTLRGTAYKGYYAVDEESFDKFWPRKRARKNVANPAKIAKAAEMLLKAAEKAAASRSIWSNYDDERGR